MKMDAVVECDLRKWEAVANIIIDTLLKHCDVFYTTDDAVRTQVQLEAAKPDTNILSVKTFGVRRIGVQQRTLTAWMEVWPDYRPDFTADMHIDLTSDQLTYLKQLQDNTHWYLREVFSHDDLKGLCKPISPHQDLLREMYTARQMPYIPPELTRLVQDYLLQVTKLIMVQPRFNEDERSHKDVPDTDQLTTTKMNMDRALHMSPYRFINPSGITWGDVMAGILWSKGSKWDRWYELFHGVIAEIRMSDGHLTLILWPEYDHGS